MKKTKFYVVWEGKKTGVFSSWRECETQIKNFPKAKFKSFETKKEAQNALSQNWKNYIGKDKIKTTKKINSEELLKAGKPIQQSISVDGAGNNMTGVVEYQGVFTETKTPLFHMKPMSGGTNNIVEFLAIVHALSYCKKHKIDYPIYSDSRIAIGWVAKKKCKTNKPLSSDNKKIFDLIKRAENWLKENNYTNQILKWKTKYWGEIPADFGRK